MANKPARSHNSAMIIAAPGSRSEGFTMIVFPVAVASGIDQSGIMLEMINKNNMTLVKSVYAGKLKGAMLILYQSVHSKRRSLRRTPCTHAKWNPSCVSIHIFADYGGVNGEGRQI